MTDRNIINENTNGMPPSIVVCSRGCDFSSPTATVECIVDLTNCEVNSYEVHMTIAKGIEQYTVSTRGLELKTKLRPKFSDKLL